MHEPRPDVSFDPSDTETRIARFAAAALPDFVGAQVEPLAGDASDRRYVRLRNPGKATIVLALHSGPFHFATLPFANVRELFGLVPLPVPRILGHSDALGLLALEDFGDCTLQAALDAASPDQRRAWYREAMDLIGRLQSRGAALASPAYVPYGLAFDAEKLTWELDFFVRHFLEECRGAAISPAERSALGEEWRAIATELAADPRVVCHRDYHSRNLMVVDGRLGVIDFQDARMGPDTYDLASLLRDSYIDIDDSELDALVADFLALNGTPKDRARDFRQRFDLMAVQRNLKALGTFGYQRVARGNAGYLQYVPRTLAYLRANLRRYPRFARLAEILAAHLEEID